jgi:hypothetical protein
MRSFTTPNYSNPLLLRLRANVTMLAEPHTQRKS